MTEQALHALMVDATDGLTLRADAARRALAARRRHRRIRSVAVAVATVAVVAAVLLPVSVRRGPDHRPPAAPPSNRTLAVSETERLIALAELPPGSKGVEVAPVEFDGPALGAPDTTALVDTTRYVDVPLSYDDAKAFVLAHPPAGLALYGSSGGGSTPYYGRAWTDPAPSSGWQQATLGIGVEPLSATASAWRLDGLAVVETSSAVRDDVPGTRVHATVAGGCPTSVVGDVGVANDEGGLDDAMIPPTEPVAVLLCRYQAVSGSDPGSGSLRAHATGGPADAGLIAAAVRDTDLTHADGITTYNGCPPRPDTSVRLLVLHGADGDDTDLWLTNLCFSVIANGHITGSPTDSLVQEVSSRIG